MPAVGNSMSKGAEKCNNLSFSGKDVEEGAMTAVLGKPQLLTMGQL